MKRVAITGVGPITPIGIGYEIFREALRDGESAICEIESFDHSPYPVQVAAEIHDFEVEEYLPTPKNYLDRNTELAFAAFKLALASAELDLVNSDRTEIGLVWGNAFAGTDTIDRFYADVAKKGPRFAKPILFPHTYANTAISFLSIEYGLDGPHLQFSSGWTASAEAIAYGVDMIKSGRCHTAIAGGAEALSETLVRFSAGQGICSPGEETSVFAQNATGIILGEGGACLILQDTAQAEKRNCRVYGYVVGVGMANQPGGWGTGKDTAIQNAMTMAMTSGHFVPCDIDLIVAGASGLPEMDSAEASAISTVFAKTGAKVCCPKSLYGETFGAAGCLQLCTALAAMTEGMVPVSDVPDTTNAKLELAVNSNAMDDDIKRVLLNTIDPGGNVVSILVEK